MRLNALKATLAGALMMHGISSLATTAPTPDPFYQYTDSTPLSSIQPGTVLKTRTIQYRIMGLPLPLKAVQLLYRSTDALSRPSVNVTTVIKPNCLLCLNRNKVISYQSLYDSLNPEDSPSRAIAGGKRLPDIVPGFETLLFAPFLIQGYTIVVPDTEGQGAHFAVGPVEGYNTLDSIRAAMRSPATGINGDAKVALVGYSGGSIGTEWAAELAPGYAPELKKNLVGAAFGGALVHPDHNLGYIEGRPMWGGVAGMAFIGIARAYDLDITTYLSDKGLAIYNKMRHQSIINVLFQYPDFYWKDIVKPEYWNRASVPEYVNSANKLIMGTGGTPDIPLFIGQGTAGEVEGTPASPVYGKGDGVMLAGDVRTLARQYCTKGVPVQHKEYALSHFGTSTTWLAQTVIWVNDRFRGKAAPQNCASIAPGNSLAPMVYTP
ncbi:MAG TPA: lipase family protein [Aquabacterium sp.]|uniref:lipase family protein n=1 Tax=Aquabacterium sp. TaxID=1872578 RepID=UPI002E2FCBF5|nr:lipase family protein [Aquabacterium sp.]HEX5356565.1 lipase family protein [Aquabacterium sp.]